jgi:hypothetical protein
MKTTAGHEVLPPLLRYKTTPGESAIAIQWPLADDVREIALLHLPVGKPPPYKWKVTSALQWLKELASGSRQLGLILEGNVAAAFLGLPFKCETTLSVRC